MSGRGVGIHPRCSPGCAGGDQLEGLPIGVLRLGGLLAVGFGRAEAREFEFLDHLLEGFMLGDGR